MKRAALLVIMAVLLLPAPLLAAAPGNGIIEGNLVNGTAGGSSVADQTVTLKTYLNDAETGSATATTDAGGAFNFSGLDTGPSYSYEVGVTYQQADYTSDRITFADGETTHPFTMAVYDATNSDAAVSVEVSHRVIKAGLGAMEVTEYYLFLNDSDHTYIGTTPAPAPNSDKTLTLLFSLPTGASDFLPGNGLMTCCIFPSRDGFVDTMPVLPGEHEIVYSYTINYPGREYTMTNQINHPAAKFDLLIQGGGVQVTSDQLTPQGPLDMGDTHFDYYTGSNLAPGDVLTVSLSGLPAAESQMSFLWVILVLALLAGGFAWAYLRRRQPRPVPITAGAGPPPEQQQLIIKLARLDDDFENGKITEEVYRRQRAATKAQLVKLMQEAE